MKKRFRIGEDEKEIIKAIGLASLLILGTLIFPNLPRMLIPIYRRRGKKGFQKTLKRLEEKGVLYLGGERIKLTKKGKELQKEIEFREIEIKKPRRWNKIWWLVSYDIPNARKKERDWFRQTLERLGFKQIQESLWVHPFECREEIAVLAQDLRISPYVIVMRTDHLPNQAGWERRFGLGI